MLYPISLRNLTPNQNINSFEEIVVSASKFEEKKKDVAQKIQVLRAAEIAFQNQSSTADVLANSGNVMVQKSQLGGGSPIIRGFETNKVLMVVDGIRMNNAIYRGGHLVVKFITPPKASEPYTTDPAPKTTSTRSMIELSSVTIFCK